MKLPFFDRLDSSEVILLAGAGGGFDVFAGLPLFLWLTAQGKKVHLANWSFSDLSRCEARPIAQIAVVRGHSSGSMEYFPERYLAQWLESKGGSQPIYALQPGGVKRVSEAYEWLVDHLEPDTIILVDGGTDILMRGDECGLGTPQEDIASLAAVHAVPTTLQKLIVCVGFGVDTYHGVCHAHFLENAAALATLGGHLGTWSLLWEMPEVREYAEAVEYVHARMPSRPSIVNGSIVSAAKGLFGDVPLQERTKDSQLFINPLMSQYWSFDLEAVARRNLYLDRIQTTETYADLTTCITRYRSGLSDIRPWVEIPH